MDEVTETAIIQTETKRKGRPPFLPTDEQRKTVAAMAGYGVAQPDIAKHLNIAPKTLRKSFREELTHSAFEANNQVMASLFTMATTRHSVAAAIFWAKTRCALRPGGSPYEKAPGAPPPKPVPPPKSQKDSRDRNGPLSNEQEGFAISVYNNDGEPNLPY